ncbi:hypothetical protein M9Y10_012447 [Tritrichomonas musculus]|uniref:Saposin B-type domain-containing protein n=1 Tax=Tritrichomonas musculus TaxID=1915356 RepID=A0ABR2ICP7_9EUKA
MLFAILIGFSLCASSICAVCQSMVETGLNLSKKGVPLKTVNSTLLKECNKQSGFLVKVGCKTYVKLHIAKLYKEANNTKLTPFQICQENKACKDDDL